jgi:hypothetical protein
MKLSTSTLVWTFVWCLFMGVTAISIGFGALFPSMNRIAKPFVCPRGEMKVDQQVYRPYPGNTITTLTWYCVDALSGEEQELGIFPMSLYAGLIYGLLLFVVVAGGMFYLANKSPSAADPQVSPHKPSQESRSGFRLTSDAAVRLKQLKDLHDANLISESEYQQKRAEIIKNL